MTNTLRDTDGWWGSFNEDIGNYINKCWCGYQANCSHQMDFFDLYAFDTHGFVAEYVQPNARCTDLLAACFVIEGLLQSIILYGELTAAWRLIIPVTVKKIRDYCRRRRQNRSEQPNSSNELTNNVNNG
ncbi:unnamed protein product [Rotaria sordida]|uniref:Uncharacterized protein n=1 Tax=Rotaria sordida TaxID=392033 RepID=A0A815JKV3_9BILA|nr:unnamed protein product [Rotaria sordida]CAF1383745.1 unnamed protein product [Rotaria sordida]CAF1536120.1 unnamed protein product [Rotaria sordida]CAF3775212.1 unnamed protein product [Rotaria sordida]